MPEDIAPNLDEKIAQCMKSIFSFSVTRTRSREDAEDLSQDILTELYRCSGSIRDYSAFYSWMWAVANNVYRRYLRKKKQLPVELDDEYPAPEQDIPSERVIGNERLTLLRRELSLMCGQYRRAVVLYYIDGLSCSEISKRLDTSVDMVKYLLFRARKKLKEGMDMTREYGEKSYKPGVFKMDYWGSGPNMVYWRLFDRKLPGNILLAAYYSPMTVDEISLELGVSTPYLEDEIEILQKHRFLRRLQNGKYQTNIIIFTESCEQEIYNQTKDLYAACADKVYDFVKANEKAIREIGFQGSDYPQNKLFWLAAHIAVINGMDRADNKNEKTTYPELSNGSHGYIWGINHSDNNCCLNGIYGQYGEQSDGSYIHISNYKMIEKCQFYRPEMKEVALMISAAKNEIENKNDPLLATLISDGYIIKSDSGFNVNFPVFSDMQLKSLIELLTPAAEIAEHCVTEVVKTAAKILRNHAPSQLTEQCDVIAQITQQLNTSALVINTMCEKSYLTIPNHRENLTMYIVVK